MPAVPAVPSPKLSVQERRGAEPAWLCEPSSETFSGANPEAGTAERFAAGATLPAESPASLPQADNVVTERSDASTPMPVLRSTGYLPCGQGIKLHS